MTRHFFEDRPRNLIPSLRRLIRVGGCANSDSLLWSHAPQFAAQHFGGVLLHIDLALKIDAISHFHELMRIACVTIFAGKLASSIRIDCPRKGHAWRGTAIQERSCRQSEVLDIVPLAQRFALRRQAGNTHQRRLVRSGQQGKTCHIGYSSFVRLY